MPLNFEPILTIHNVVSFMVTDDVIDMAFDILLSNYDFDSQYT